MGADKFEEYSLICGGRRCSARKTYDENQLIVEQISWLGKYQLSTEPVRWLQHRSAKLWLRWLGMKSEDWAACMQSGDRNDNQRIVDYHMVTRQPFIT